MKTIICIILSLFLLVMVTSIIWRFFSNRASLPCPVWLSWMVEMDNPFTKTNRAAVIISHLDLKSWVNVLDAGCGPGRLTIPLAQKVGPTGTVTAVDVQLGMLARVKEKAQIKNIENIVYRNVGIGDGKLETNHYDCALLVTVLGEIPDQEKAIRELFEALKSGGTLSVTEVIFDPHFQWQNTVRHGATTAGFQEKALFGNRIAYTMHFEKP